MKKNNVINWKAATKKEVETDFAPLQSFYNFDLNKCNVGLGLQDIQSFGICVDSKSTSEIHKTPYTQLENSIIFYSKSEKIDVKELVRHFKNLVSHPEHIKKAYINGELYYRLYDVNKRYYKDSMKAVIAVSTWKTFSKQLMDVISKNLKR